MADLHEAPAAAPGPSPDHSHPQTRMPKKTRNQSQPRDVGRIIAEFAGPIQGREGSRGKHLPEVAIRIRVRHRCRAIVVPRTDSCCGSSELRARSTDPPARLPSLPVAFPHNGNSVHCPVVVPDVHAEHEVISHGLDIFPVTPSCIHYRISNRIMGRVADLLNTSRNPAFRKAEGIPVQTNGSGVRVMVGTTGYPSTIAAPCLPANSTAARIMRTEFPWQR